MSRGEPYGKRAPCAFCGGKATLAPMPGTRGWWQVRCRAYLCGGTTWDMSEVELAVDAWNRRHRCIVAFRRPTVRQQGLLEAGAGGLGRIASRWVQPHQLASMLRSRPNGWSCVPGTARLRKRT